METIIFGTFDFAGSNVVYNAPAVLPTEIQKKFNFEDGEILNEDDEEVKVTHSSFFGENIRRAIKILSKK